MHCYFIAGEKSRPLPCLACNRVLEGGSKYLRMPDPAGGKTTRDTDVVRYLHGDGSLASPLRHIPLRSKSELVLFCGGEEFWCIQ